GEGSRVGGRSAGGLHLDRFSWVHGIYIDPAGRLRAPRAHPRAIDPRGAGRAVTGPDQRIDRLIYVGVRHHDHVILGAAEALHAFAVRTPRGIDVFCNGGRADETDRMHTGIGEQCVHRFLVAVDHVEHARWKSSVDEEFSEPHWHRGIPLRRLENKCVAAGERGRELPHRNHGREVEWRDASDNSERLAQREQVDAGPSALAEFPFQQVWDTAGELDYFESALDVAFGVGDRLAVLGGEELGETVEFLLHPLEELEQHARATLRVGRRPDWLRRL